MTCRAALQPVLYAPLAMWALQSPTPLADRSGNARDLTGTPSKRPDLQLTKTAVCGAGTGLQQTGAVFRLTGAFTLTCRCWYDGNTAVNPVADQSLSGVGTQFNTLFTVGISNKQLFYYREVNGPTGAVGVANATDLKRGKWYFASFRRAADGAMTIGVDFSSFQTFAVTPPVDGSSTRLQLGRDAEPGQLMNGAFADVGIWDKRLTDDELFALYRPCMGR